MRNIKLIICYDGTEFHGWQRQPDLRTVQQTLEVAIRQVTGVEPTCNATSRTDAGVHALGQVVSFQTESAHAPETFVKALNANLPADLRVLSAQEMPESFHATISAKKKMYRYSIDNCPIADPFRRRYAWHVYHKLDIGRMNEASCPLIGKHDFRSFESNWPNRPSSVRTLYRIEITRQNEAVAMEIEGDGFLYNMVRAIMGTLVVIGNGRRPVTFAGDALQAMSRAAAGPTAPAHGLALVKVWFE